ncbi:MAG: drug/metabolite transporter (DMT)-like permease [Polaribacter sp.]|jgi:drug/metabolite transporter (DMT)-like permease
MLNRPIPQILLATLAFAIMNTFAKELSTFHPLQVVFFRAFGTWIFIFPYMLYNKVPLIGNNVKFLMLRGVVGVISLACFFMAVQMMPLGSAVSIRYLGPIFGAVLAYFYLKEKITLVQWLSFAVSFTGVIVLKGFDLRISTYALLLVLNSALFVGIVFVLLRYLGTREHHLTIINYFMVTSLFVSLFSMAYWRMPNGAEWIPVVGIGTTGLFGQLLMTKAFQKETTSVLAPFKYMELVYALLIGFFFLGETYEWIPFSGIALIILGMVLNVWGKPKP